MCGVTRNGDGSSAHSSVKRLVNQFDRIKSKIDRAIDKSHTKSKGSVGMLSLIGSVDVLGTQLEEVVE